MGEAGNDKPVTLLVWWVLRLWLPETGFLPWDSVSSSHGESRLPQGSAQNIRTEAGSQPKA